MVTRFLVFLLMIATIVGVAIARYEDCESPPIVKHGTIRMEDDEDTVRAIYTCNAGYDLKGITELICDLDTDEWNTDPPTCVKSANDVEQEENAAGGEQRKKRPQDIVEDPNVSPQMAVTLDMSCVQAKVKAPEIRHGVVQKYDRRRRGEKIFLVALYTCNENFEFEDSEIKALYCSNRQWVGEIPTCIPLGEYTEEDEEDEYEEYETVDENEEDGEERGLAHVAPPPPPPPTQPQVVEKEQEEVAPEPSNEVVDAIEEPEIPPPIPESESDPALETNNLEPSATPMTDINIVVAPTLDPYTPRLLDQNCGDDKGGCAHICERLLFPGENEPRLKCSCFKGFSLDPSDYSSCHDINECQLNNGGCEQICNNLPGSFECGCERGLQIDTLTGKTCVDINECDLPEIAAECEDGCENTHGSYRCTVPVNNREDSEAEIVKEQEEREQNVVRTDEAVKDNKGVGIAEQVECGVGYSRSNDGKCVDIDECAEGISGCVHCLNTEGSFECTCPPGYDLAEDGKTCVDINECEIVVNQDEDDAATYKVCSHICENTLGSFICSCGANQHLLDDRRTCVPDTCGDLNNPQLNKTRCAHQCIDHASGFYECVCPAGYKLGEDAHSCTVAENACSRHDGYERCAPGTCVPAEDNANFNCICPPGYFTQVQSCQDIDECVASKHQCSHDCVNSEGGYHCSCPPDMLLGTDGYTCFANDACSVNNNGCEQICKSAEAGACDCDKGYTLSADGKSCHDIDECQNNNGNCQQLCYNLPGSHVCGCKDGYELQADQSCRDIDECAAGKHSCTHECVNAPGAYECTCPFGYALQLDGFTCKDETVCESTHGCSHSCTKKQGVDVCSCPEGYFLSSDRKMCSASFVSCPPGTKRTLDGSGCEQLKCAEDNGGCSHQCDDFVGCSCLDGFELGADGKTCVDIDECRTNNGGCSHGCQNKFGIHECSCPVGMKLFGGNQCVTICDAGFTTDPANPNNCVDINECERPGLCQYECVNKPGWYECRCPNGYRVAANGECEDIDECANNNGGCVGGTCINHKGSYQCRCGLSQILANDRRTCEYRTPQRDQCAPLLAPMNGDIRCTKYRHKRKLFYNTKCKVWCKPGFTLHGPPQRFCNASGNWDEHENRCLPTLSGSLMACTRLPLPRNGVILPTTCTQGKSFSGESCRLQCNPGYVPISKSISYCTATLQWSFGGPLDCQPIQQTDASFNSFLPVKQTRIPAFNDHWNQKPLRHDLERSTAAFGQQQPYITCPQNSTVLLHGSQETAHVILQKPVTNLDYRYIQADPAWGKDLNAHLPAGQHEIFYSGLDSVSGKRAACTTIITVRHAESVGASFCTPSFEVTLKENQYLRSVVWKEPRFEGEIRNIYKSNFPGALFGVGIHPIFYEATNSDGVTMRCEFQIHVKASSGAPPSDISAVRLNYSNRPSAEMASLPEPALIPASGMSAAIREGPVLHANTLVGHESYVICAGQAPVKVTAHQSVSLPMGCMLKNMRLRPRHQSAVRRGFLTSRWAPLKNFLN